MNKRQQAYYRRLAPSPKAPPVVQQHYLSLCLIMSIAFSLYTLIFMLNENQQIAWAQDVEKPTFSSTKLATARIIPPKLPSSFANLGTYATPQIPNPLTDTIINFIQGYFSALAANDINSLMNYYANEVNYYAWGLVEKDMVKQEKMDFFERWPDVEQRLLGDLNIREDKQSTVVSYRLYFSVHNANNKSGEPLRIDGEAIHTWHLVFDSAGQPKIIFENQHVIKRQRAYN